jgi:hypothetical protein
MCEVGYPVASELTDAVVHRDGSLTGTYHAAVLRRRCLFTAKRDVQQWPRSGVFVRNLLVAASPPCQPQGLTEGFCQPCCKPRR